MIIYFMQGIKDTRWWLTKGQIISNFADHIQLEFCRCSHFKHTFVPRKVKWEFFFQNTLSKTSIFPESEK